MKAVVSQTGIDHLVAAAATSRLLLLFDFDGTLSPTVDRPELARLPERTRRVLVCLSMLPGCRVGIVSGRSLDDLSRRIDLSGVLLVGSGGLEWNIDDVCSCVPEAATSATAIEALAANLDEQVAHLPGVWLERKPLGLTIHHRGVDCDTKSAVRELASRLCNARGADMRVVACAMGVEITPCRSHDKGSAVQILVASMGSGSISIAYAGNDLNDAEAMVMVHRLSGWTLSVGPDAPPADQHLKDPEQLTEWLETLAVKLCTPVG